MGLDGFDGSNIRPCVSETFNILGLIGLSGPMTSTSWTHGCFKQSYWKV